MPKYALPPTGYTSVQPRPYTCPSALVEFTLEGKTVTQPLGEVVARVKDISLQVPEVVDKPQFIVSGMAEGLADVTIYSNDQVIGPTRALANWNGWMLNL